MNTPPKTVQDFVAAGWPFGMAEYKALEAERDALRETLERIAHYAENSGGEAFRQSWVLMMCGTALERPA